VRSFTHVWQAGRQFLTGATGTGLLAAQHLERPFPLYPAGDAPANLGGGGERNAVPIYDVPSVNVVKHLLNDPPLRVSALRALGAYANIFAMESFMDEAAALAGVDPVEFRLRHLVDERWKSLIQITADRAGWSEPLPGVGRGRGFAFARYKNTAGAMAVAVAVEVDRNTGAARVERATAAVDVGLAINPLGVKDQIEGGIIQAISWTLHEQVRYADGRVTSTDFSSYPILSVADAPEIDIHVMERSDQPPLGVGETAQGPTAAAIANAIFAACRARVREIPITPERILAVRPPLL
jgi:CO/xanthine dehydrogenase Mo-binding subunit